MSCSFDLSRLDGNLIHSTGNEQAQYHKELRPVSSVGEGQDKKLVGQQSTSGLGCPPFSNLLRQPPDAEELSDLALANSRISWQRVASVQYPFVCRLAGVSL